MTHNTTNHDKPICDVCGRVALMDVMIGDHSKIVYWCKRRECAYVLCFAHSRVIG